MGLKAVEFNNNNKEWRSHKRGWQNFANTIQGRARKRKSISIPLQGLYRVRRAPLREPLDIAVHAANCAKADFQSLKIGIVFWVDNPDTVCSVTKVEIVPTRSNMTDT